MSVIYEKRVHELEQRVAALEAALGSLWTKPDRGRSVRTFPQYAPKAKEKAPPTPVGEAEIDAEIARLGLRNYVDC